MGQSYRNEKLSFYQSIVKTSEENRISDNELSLTAANSQVTGFR